MIGDRAHALLSASGANKWLNCTPSARLEETFQDTQSEYAAEGSLAHEVAELKLRKYFLEPIGPRKFNNQIKKFKENPLWDDEILKHTDVYLEYVQSIAHQYNSSPYVAVEKKILYDMYVPEGFGTGDCILIGGNTLYVIDFKYGKGVPVPAEDNSQMKLYALGAYAEYSFLYNIETIKLVIIQPRLNNISEYELSAADLLEWGESIKPIAEKAFKGEGEFISGDHCRFCRAKSLCRARTEFNISLEEFNQMKPPLISNEEVGQILERAQNLAKWVKDLEEYALSACLQGEIIPGWKAVEGRGSRQYTDIDVAFEDLKSEGIDEALLYERKPLTVPALEKVLGKKQYRELLEGKGHVKSEPGKPTLARESDKRESITNKVTPEEAFKNE
ncbi:DUF2800 domain-containing protein [Tissierella sp.]|jgi:hypothetical protein|uniref:DUF2800 domain-containing protein n=1 Tax=Tissierella sp. TaxID=41274 RepID=UPI0030316E20